MPDKILSIDDAYLFQLLLKEKLLPFGYDFITAHDTDDGIIKFINEKPKFTLIDITMPGRNGIECTKEILNIDPNATVIIFSATINPIILTMALEKGANDIISKDIMNGHDRDAFFRRFMLSFQCKRTFNLGILKNIISEYDMYNFLNQNEIDEILNKITIQKTLYKNGFPTHVESNIFIFEDEK